jgi:hypothetical protein
MEEEEEDEGTSLFILKSVGQVDGNNNPFIVLITCCFSLSQVI